MRTLDPRKWPVEQPRWLAFVKKRLYPVALRVLNCVTPRADQKIALARDQLATVERRYGPDSPLTANAMEMLSRFLREDGQFDEAASLAQEVLDRRKHNLGPEHEHTALAEADLGNILCLMGRDREAVPLLEHSVSVRSSIEGAESMPVLGWKVILGGALVGDGRYEEARVVLEHALDSLRRIAPDDKETFNAMAHLAWAFSRQRKYGSAIALGRESVEGRSRVLGFDHSETVTARLNLATDLYNNGQHGEAGAFVMSVLESQVRRGAQDDPETARANSLLAAIDEAETG